MPRRKKDKYSTSIYCIIVYEFCERFTFYGIRAILSLYLNDALDLGQQKTLIVYHLFIFMTNFFPIFGALIADTWLGKYWTILILSFIYIIGEAMMTSATIVGKTNERANYILVWFGLTLIAIGTGGVKPCVAAFGGDQFVLPEENEGLNGFYSLFYFALNIGGITSFFIVPLLRRSVKCLGAPDCYPLAFGTPSLLMITSIFVFIAGRKQYKRHPPEGNLLFKISPCICYALRMKLKYGQEVEKPHWLDYAEDKYDKNLIEDLKITLKILFMFVPLPVFWCLYDQQGSEWVFQATRMNGDLHFFKITPDQMQVMNPIGIAIFIPIIRWGLYPLLKIIGISRPLQRMMLGGIFTAISFVAAGFVSLKIERTIPDVPINDYAQLRIYNTLNCTTTVFSKTINHNEPIQIQRLDKWEQLFVPIKDSTVLRVYISMRVNCSTEASNRKWINGSVYLHEKAAFGCYIFNGKLTRIMDDVRKHPQEQAKIRFLFNIQEFKEEVTNYPTDNEIDSKTKVTLTSQTTGKSLVRDIDDRKTFVVAPDVYDLNIAGLYEEKNLWLRYGAIYSVLGVNVKKVKWVAALRTVVMPNTISILYQLPQYALISVGEVLFVITGTEFAYSQAPNNLKSILQAFWLLTNAIGDLILVGVDSMGLFKRQSANFFMFAMFMVANLIFFAMLSSHYEYLEISTEEE